MKRKITALLLATLLGISVVGCQNNTGGGGDEPPVDTAYTADQKYIYGMDYIIYERLDFDYVKGLQLLNNLGVKSLRHWMHFDWFMDEEMTLKQSNVNKMKEILAEIGKYDMQVIGMSHKSFNYTGNPSLRVPYDKTEGSEYWTYLGLYEEAWYTLAKTFPEITMWEIDNETNNIDFMHSTEGGGFSLSEMTDISTDLFYYGSKGVHRANPDAVTIMGGCVTWNAEAFIEGVYENIKSGRFGEGSTNPDDYFQALAWHPYTTGFDADSFVEDNQAIYDIAYRYEGKHKTVYFTELGNWTNNQTPEKAAEYLQAVYQTTLERLPFVESIHYYGMFDNIPDNNNRYGIFADPNPKNVDNGPDGRLDPGSPKPAAYAYQTMAGGTGSLDLLRTPLENL